MQHFIETINLTKKFGAKKALSDFSLKVDPGGIHAIVGSNGAGKSTLFRILLGIESPTSGAGYLLGEDSRSLPESVRGRVGYVNEEHTLPTWMTAQGVMDFQRAFYPNWSQEIFDQVIGYFDVDPKQKVSGLSRGERAGLNLAMALAQTPSVLILDEPTLGLDIVAKQSFLEALMFTETEYDSTIIYCSHQMEEIERVADKLIIMEKGHLVNNSSPDEFVQRVSYWVGEFGGDSFAKDKMPGFLTAKLIDGQHHILVADQGPEFGQQLANMGASNISQSSVNLERAVNAFLTKNHKSPSGAYDRKN